MENNTAVQPINTTEIELVGILDKVAQEKLKSNPDSTAIELPTSYDSTATSNNNWPKSYPAVNILPGYNREVRRYAKKHNLTDEEAFKRLYK